MASLGDLIIKIGGDVEGFKAAMADAMVSADVFTNKITSSISQGVTLFDAYGRSVQSAAAPTAELASANDKLAAAAFNAANGMVLAGEAAEKAASSHGHAITEIQAVSGSLRTLESNGGIRAAERFLTMIPGLAGALQIGFPLVGAVAFSEVLARIFEKIDPLAKAEKHLEEVNKQVDQSFEQIATRIESIHVQEITEDFGKLQGLKLQGFYDADAASRDRDNIKALEAQMATLQRQIESTRTLPQFFSNPVRAFNPLEIGMQAGQMMDARANDRNVQAIQSQIEEAQFRLRQFEAQDRLNKKQQDKAAADEALEASRKQHDALRQADEDALALEKSQHQMSVGETISFWQKRQAAESGNVDRVREINITLGNLYQERDKMLARVVEHGAKLMDEQAKKAEEWASKMEGLAVDAQKLIDSSVKQLGERTTKLNDIGIQSNAQGQEGALEFKKLDAEKEFAGLVFQTESRRIALLQQEATISQQMLQIQIEALALKQQQEEDPVKKAALGLELQKATIDAAKQAEQAQIRITEEKRRQGLADQLGSSAMRIPGAVGNSLAAGIMSGKNIGQDIANSLKGIGQQMLGSIFNRLISTMLQNIAVHIGLTAATSTNAAATTAHSGIMLSHAGVMLTHMGAVVLNTIATVANTLWTAILTAVEAVKSFFGFADGGSPPVGVPSIVGERGPELFIPKQAGVIIPNHQLNFRPSGQAASMSSSQTVNGGNNTFHFHGVQDVRGMMRAIASVAKTASPQFSPAASR